MREVTQLNVKEVSPATGPWGNVTNPHSHNPNKFRYLVHAFNPYSALLNAQEGLPGEADGKGRSQMVNLLEDPLRLNERISLSCSLISQDKLGTWGSAGLIVEAPKDTVVSTTKTDAGTISGDRRRIIGRSGIIMDPERLLEKTSPDLYNEVVILPGEAGKEVKLAGFFYKNDPRYGPHNSHYYETLKSYATAFRLPIISIDAPNKENQIIEDFSAAGKLKILFNERIYVFSPSEGLFTFTDPTGTYSISPPDFRTVIPYYLERGGNSEQVSSLKAAYDQGVAKRHVPTVVRDTAGQIVAVRQIQGFGKAERVGYLDELGLKQRLNKSRHAHMSSIAEAETMVNTTIKHLPPQEKEELKRWWIRIKPSVNKSWQTESQARQKGKWNGIWI